MTSGIPMRTLIDPRFDRGNLVAGELAIHRHGWPFEARDAPVQSAFLCFAWNNRRPFFAALKCALERTQVQLRKLHCFAVALQAAILQNRLNVLCVRNFSLCTGQSAGQSDDPAGYRQSAHYRGDNGSLAQVPPSLPEIGVILVIE